MSVETFRLDLTANVHCHVLFELSNCSFLAKTLSSSDQVFATTKSDTENYFENKNKAKNNHQQINQLDWVPSLSFLFSGPVLFAYTSQVAQFVVVCRLLCFDDLLFFTSLWWTHFFLTTICSLPSHWLGFGTEALASFEIESNREWARVKAKSAWESRW